MQKHRSAAHAVLGTLALAVLTAATGCSQDARSELAKATDKARRLCDRACSLLNDPVYKVGDKYAPLTAETPTPDANDITVMPVGQVNPEAAQALDEAIRGLTTALADAPADAPAVEKVRAHAVLGRLHAMVGFRWALGATAQRAVAWARLRKLENAAIGMSDNGKRVATCDALLSATDKSLGEMESKAKADATAAEGKIADLTKQIESLKAQKKSLEAQNETLVAAARKLRVDSQLADVVKSIDLFDQARAKEDTATANSVKITEIEDSVQFLTSQVATLQVDVAAAQKRTTVAGEIAAARAKRKADLQTERDGFVKLLTASQAEAEKLAGSVIEATKAVSAVEQKATAAYAEAEKQYSTYSDSTRKTAAGGPDAPPMAEASIIALFGDVRMAEADLLVRSLTLQKRISEVVDRVTKLWTALPVQKTPPAIIAQAAGYLPDVNKTRSEAQEKFRWAAKNYESAVGGVGRKQAWAYRIQVAAAYTGLYRLSSDADAKQKAMAELDKLGDEEASRFVAPNAAGFRKLLEAGGGAPAPAPAPVPAPVPGPTTQPAAP